MVQVREITLDMITDMGNYEGAGLRWQSSAILALQEASEAFLVHVFENACVYLLVTHTLIIDCACVGISVPSMQSESRSWYVTYI